MSQDALEQIAKKGICSLESIEDFRNMAEELEKEPQRNEILESERLLKAIADRTRIKLILLLSKGEMCVCQLAAVSGLKQPSVSSSLRILEKVGLLKREQRGKWHYYSLTDNNVTPLVLNLVKW